MDSEHTVPERGPRSQQGNKFGVSCFFCQNLLSDFVEGVLPQSRHRELKEHIAKCPDCTLLHDDLVATLGLLQRLPKALPTPELELRLVQAALAGRGARWTKSRLTFVALLVALPLLSVAGAVAVFPDRFPWLRELAGAAEEAQFVRYSPLAQGAADIVEEQANWLNLGEAGTRSVWEEGGLSPDEFEKAFQLKPGEKASE
jgi:hypothetical protein